MLSEKSKQHLIHAISNQEIAEELIKRLTISSLPNQAQAQALLDSYKISIEKLREYLIVATANKEVGDEISNRLEKAITVLEAIADGNEVAGSPAVAASFEGQVLGMTEDITITADNEGEDGNSVLLEFDGLDDIDTVVLAWNTANPANTVMVDGDGSQIPDDQETIQLSGGEDEVLASDANTAPAVAAFGTQSLSEKAMEHLTVALADEQAAKELKALYDNFVSQLND